MERKERKETKRGEERRGEKGEERKRGEEDRRGGGANFNTASVDCSCHDVVRWEVESGEKVEEWRDCNIKGQSQ